MVELSFIAIFICISFITGSQVLIYHCLVIAAGELFSAFFAVWTVHHDLEEGEIARTQRKGWKNFITYNMFYHLEHHMYPSVPTINLPKLARRIDEAMPELRKKSTF